MSDQDPIVRYPYFKIDHHANAVYITVTDLSDRAANTVSITPHINADYDEHGKVIGIELLSTKIDFGEEFRWKPESEPT